MVRLILIEGGIAVGKTALCNLLKSTISDIAIVNIEPVNEWIEWVYKGNTYTPLKDSYNIDGGIEIFNLQSFIQCSMFNSLCKAYFKAKAECKKFLICERSIASSVEIFARYSHNSNLLYDKQFAILEYWYNTLRSLHPKLFNFETIFHLRCPDDES